MKAAEARKSNMFRAALAVGVFLWISIALLFAAFPVGTHVMSATATGAQFGAGLFAAAGFALAIRAARGTGRIFWVLLAAGICARVVGDILWTFQPSAFDPLVHSPHHIAYSVFYLSFFVAMSWLLSSMRKNAAPVDFLDAAGVMAAFGVAVSYIVLTPAGIDGWRDFSWVLSRPVFDMGLLFLALAAFRVAGRPPFVGFFLAGLLLFVAGDALYLELRSDGPYARGDWPELFWIGGVMLLGFAALRGGGFPSGFGGSARAVDRLSSWMGLTVPPLLFAFTLVWGFFDRPIPDYVLFGGIFVMLLVASRMALIARINEKLARRSERELLSEELHDGFKQNLQGIILTAGAIKKHLKKEDLRSARKAAEDAVEMAREAHERVSRPISELGMSRPEDPIRLLDGLFEDMRRYFHTLEVRDGLRPALQKLSLEELGAAYRIISEALWNAAKHSGAKTARVEARRVGKIVLVNVRDDGRGFLPGEQAGMGVGLMRERARRVGAKLEIYSSPERGTTVQMRFGR